VSRLLGKHNMWKRSQPKDSTGTDTVMPQSINQIASPQMSEQTNDRGHALTTDKLQAVLIRSTFEH